MSAPKGQIPWNKGKTGTTHVGTIPSQETRLRLSLAKRGKKILNYPKIRKSPPPFSKEHLRKMSIAWEKNRDKKVGSNSNFWKGGCTKTNQKIRNSIEYRLWRESVLKRDGGACIWCGSIVDLHVDHIKPFAHYPELRFAIDNGRTLCKRCHSTTDTYCGKAKLCKK